MTFQILLWALGTGFVTGAVWFAILFFRRNARPKLEQPDPAKLEDLNRRLLELEERLDFTEHRITREKVEQPRKPSG
jgi:hypothetical protein